MTKQLASISVGLAALATLCLAVPTAALAQDVKGQGITMAFKQGQEPKYPNGSLNFNAGAYAQQPLVYRTVVDLPGQPSRAPIRIQAKWFAYVWVNGQCVADKTDRTGDIFMLDADLAPYLKSGKNVLAVSAVSDGFALAGKAVTNGKTVAITTSPESWNVWKFAPLTIMETESFVTSVDGDAKQLAPTAQTNDFSVTLSDADADGIITVAEVNRLAPIVGDVPHEAELMVKRGIAIVNDQTIGFAGPMNLPPESIAAAQAVLDDLALWQGVWQAVVDDRNALAEGKPMGIRPAPLAAAKILLGDLRVRMDAAKMLVQVSNRLKYAQLAGKALAGGPFIKADGELAVAKLVAQGDAGQALATLARMNDDLDQVDRMISAELGAPINKLNEAIANKAAWVDDASLVDSMPGAWGVRFNPVETSWFMDLAGMWRFKLDPNNTGMAEGVTGFGYNIANQWPELQTPGTWEKQGFQLNNPKANEQTPCPGVNVRTDGPYNGWAIYRKKILVPAEWAGYDLELYMGAVDDFDWTYWNGDEVGHTDAITNPDNFWMANRSYKIPKDKVTFGGYNVIVIRVYDCGAGGGIANKIELRCPSLQKSFEARAKETAKVRKPTTVFSSPLSPAAVLTVGENDLEMFGWDFRGSAGPEGIVLSLGGKIVYKAFPALASGERTTVVYDAAKDGGFSANWALLWAKPGRLDGELPIQLVFLSQPKTITVTVTAMGTQKMVIDFGKPGQQLFALRPIRADSKAAEATDASVTRNCEFWSRASLAYPVGFAELAKLADGRKDKLEVTDVYDYRMFTDAWGTEAIKLAPLPPLASFGLKVNARDLTTAAKPLPLSLGEYGQFHGVIGAEAVRYTVPVDTLPRLAGFTSYCFGPDVGVPGNHKELEIMAWTGCNSYRPQSNEGVGQRIMNLIPWTNEQGMNFCFNVDGGFGAQPGAVDHYVQLGKALKNLPDWAVAYDLINEPANMTPEAYNPQIKRMVEALREVDTKHMVLIETPHSFASIDQFVNLAPVDDDKAVYTFHDYDYRLRGRWPRMTTDIRNMEHQWLPAFKFALEHDAPISISEYGGFEQGGNPWDNRSALVQMNDFFKVFDKFGFHHHYYSNRGIVQIRADGSIRMSYVHQAYRDLFAGDTFYRFRDNWQEGLKR